MATSPTLPPRRLSDRDNEPLANYHAVSAAAVLGLVLGIGGPLALLSTMLWAVPALGAVVSAFAIWRVGRSAGLLVGGKAARLGLVLSLFFLTAAVSGEYLYRWLVARQAEEFAQAWFDFLAADEPQKAYALTVPPMQRPALAYDESVWEFYRSGPRWRRDLDGYVADKLVGTLLALGKKAQVRFYLSDGYRKEDDGELLQPIYAVTFDDAQGRRTTFFVRMHVLRVALTGGQSDWRLLRAEGGIRPAA